MDTETNLTQEINLGILRLVTGADDVLFMLLAEGVEAPLKVSGPLFEVDGKPRSDFRFTGMNSLRNLPGGGQETELGFVSSGAPDLGLRVIVRSFAHSSILRFRYILTASSEARLTKNQGVDRLTYFQIQQAGLETSLLTEYQLSHFDSLIHSYLPNREDWSPDEVIPGKQFVGPVALLHHSHSTVMVAYEHGVDHPQSFFDYVVLPQHGLELKARKANYYAGQPIGPEESWSSVWFELGLKAGSLEAFLPDYRSFFLNEVCENSESRQPYIYYNTWNYQERQKYFKGRPYTESMTAERMLAEIDVAHQLGVEVFVIDTGWYIKTGDWLPNLDRFPEGLKEIKRRLDQYGMKMGLWFNPTVAALTAKVFVEHPEWEMTQAGKPSWRGVVWETEESTGMCLASDYMHEYVEVMVRLHNELGVIYFKWDGISQYGCDSPLHRHGTETNSPEERAECYAFEMGRSMIQVVEEVTRRCPGVIVDFDITEGGRFVGLGFLSAGKFFLVNNGPYFSSLDIPNSVKITPDTINVFFYPGPARPRICRTGARYDNLIPSVLFLTHYLPDAPRLSQRNSIASLVLGGNGFWGDLPALADEDVAFLSEQISYYKQVRESLTRAYPRVRGYAGSSPEIHEKIEPEAACGAVVFFTVTPGTVVHYTQPLAAQRISQVIGADAWEVVDGGRLKITMNLEREDARVVYVLPFSAL